MDTSIASRSRSAHYNHKGSADTVRFNKLRLCSTQGKWPARSVDFCHTEADNQYQHGCRLSSDAVMTLWQPCLWQL
jgi:hypothetical protein